MPRKNLISLHEAIVLALINSPIRTANFAEIAHFINSRNLYPNRKGNIALEDQIMLRATKAKGAYHHLFEEIGAGYIRLKESTAYLPIHLSNAFEEILKLDSEFYEPQLVEINLIRRDGDINEQIRLKVKRSKVVCISTTTKGREKTIYIESEPPMPPGIYAYSYNKGSFAEIINKLDKLNDYLVQISGQTVVNVAYYWRDGKQSLRLIDLPNNWSVPESILMHSISRKNKGHDYQTDFEKVFRAYQRRIFLQKAAINYRSQNDL